MGSDFSYCCNIRQKILKPESPKPISKIPPSKHRPKKKVPPDLKRSDKPSQAISPLPTPTLKSLELPPSKPLTTDIILLESPHISRSSSTALNSSTIPNEEAKVEEIVYLDLPNYSLNPISSLSEREQKEISWLLLQFQATSEEIDGFLPVSKKNRYGIKQSRWILFTTESLYIVLPHKFTVCRHRVKLVEIMNVFYTSDSSIFSIEVMAQEKYFLTFHSKQTENAVNAISTLKYFITNELSEPKVVRSEKEISVISSIQVNEIEQDLLFLKIKADYGYPGEELIKSFEVSLINSQKLKEMFYLLVTNKTIYVLNSKKKMYNFVDHEVINSIAVIEERNEAVLITEEGDLWMSSIEIELVIQDLCLLVSANSNRIIELTTESAENFNCNFMKQMKSNKKRSIKIAAMNESIQVQVKKSGNYIESLIKAI